MSYEEMLGHAQAIGDAGHGVLGAVLVSRRAYDELGGLRCLELVRRYACVDGPGIGETEDIPPYLLAMRGPVHESRYTRGGQVFVAVTETQPQQVGQGQRGVCTYLGRLDEVWPEGDEDEEEEL